MSFVRRVSLSFGAVAILTAALGPGCGGDDSNPAIADDNDGGIVAADGSDDDGSSSDGGGGGDVIVTDGSRDAGDPYCAAVAAYNRSCGVTGACADARLAQCPEAEAILSDAYRSAYVDCTTLAPCPGAADAGDGGGGRKDYAQCLASHIGALTNPQKKLAIDYCTRCDDRDAGVCVADFYKTYGNIYGLDDALVTSIDTTCATGDAGSDDGGDSGLAACTKAFDKCSREAIAKAQPPRPAECAGDGG